MAARPISGPGREDVVAAAVAVLDAEGPTGLTVRRVADALGSSTQIVYSRFGGMDGLLAAVGVAVFREIADLAAAVPESPDPLTEVTDLALALRAYSLANPHRIALMTAPITNPEAHAQAKAEAGLSMARMIAPVARALPDLPPARIADLTEVLWASLAGMVDMERGGHLEPDGAEDRIRMLITRLLD